MRLRLLLLLGLFLSCATQANESIRWALGMWESSERDHAVGASGELSRYQIMPQYWRQHAKKGMRPSNPDHAWYVAERILAERRRWFVSKTKRQPTPFDLYVMWHRPGTYARAGFRPERLPALTRTRATRFANLVRVFEERQQLAHHR